MTTRKLTQLEILELFAFCKKKGIKHYDLQIELVDHLASAIEQKLQEQPQLSLAEALPEAYKQFGVYGFPKFKEIKEKALRKKYNRLQWRYIGEFYRMPKVIATIFISLLLFFAIKTANDLTLFGLISLGIYALALLFYFVVFSKKKSSLELTTGKSFLQIDYLNAVRGSVFSVGFIPFNLLTITSITLKRFHFSPIEISILELLTSFFITFFVYVMIAMIFYLPHRIKADFIREYPQFVKA